MDIKVHIDKANSISKASLTLSSETKKINFALTDRQTFSIANNDLSIGFDSLMDRIDIEMENPKWNTFADR